MSDFEQFGWEPDELGGWQRRDEGGVIEGFLGICRFDANLIASEIRSRPLTRLEALALASLIDGKPFASSYVTRSIKVPKLRLRLTGQGRNWVGLKEAVDRSRRELSMFTKLTDLRAEGLTWEEATIEVAEQFAVSEATVARAVRGLRGAIANDD